MQKRDPRRFAIYSHYSTLHEFIPEEINDDLTLEEKNAARMTKKTKLAREVEDASDLQKIDMFKKYEMMNMKTMRCRNQVNLSPVVRLNQNGFDAAQQKKLMKDESLLLIPRLQAQKALQQHLESVESASQAWFSNNSRIAAYRNAREIAHVSPDSGSLQSRDYAIDDRSHHIHAKVLERQSLNQQSSKFMIVDQQ
jgi:hypothetical protein